MNDEQTSADRLALLQEAVAAVEEMQAKVDRLEQEKVQPIAIVGIACRFPGGGDNPDAFWEMLRDGVDAVSEVPAERWDVDAYFDTDPDAPGKMYTRWGAFLKDVDKFDAAFFGISPREAAAMDPAQRLLLECTWESFENAGIAPGSLEGSRTGAYVGITLSDYGNFFLKTATPTFDVFSGSGVAHGTAAGRLSYTLGLSGPCLALDTACSSSLAATHLACQSLRSGESDMAVAGGVNLTLLPDATVATCRARMLSFDGHCKTFDASADGYVRSEGCAMVVLKRLSDAIADDDNIQAVIYGSAMNQDGKSNGLTAPNGSCSAGRYSRSTFSGRFDSGFHRLRRSSRHWHRVGRPNRDQGFGGVFLVTRTQDEPH